MKILVLGDPVLDGQDMLFDSLVYGLTRVYGMANVDDYLHSPRYRGGDEFLSDWPVHLGALSYRAMTWAPKGRFQQDLDCYDVIVLHPRFLNQGVILRVIPSVENARICTQMDWSRVIYVDGGDTAGAIHPDARFSVARPRHVGFHMTAHISVPEEYIAWQKTRDDMRLPHDVFAAWSDNIPIRREVMQALAEAKRNSPWQLRFGSGENYTIKNTKGTVGIPQYYRELSSSRCAVACRGVGIDTLRIWEIFACNVCAITQDFGFSDEFIDGIHCLYYETPDECVKQVRWALSHEDEAKEIARTGHLLYSMRHTPEAQAQRIIAQSGIWPREASRYERMQREMQAGGVAMQFFQPPQP